MTTIPYDPAAWHSDGRLYPPLPDSVREVEEVPQVVRYRSRGHNTFIGDNGSIEIAGVSEGVPPANRILEKPGADGRSLWQQTTTFDD